MGRGAETSGNTRGFEAKTCVYSGVVDDFTYDGNWKEQERCCGLFQQ